MKKLILLSVIISTLSLGACAFDSEDELTLQQINQVQIPMPEAIAKAESTLSGKVGKIKLEKEEQQYVYDLEVVTKDKTLDVKMDANSGAIIHKADD